MARTEARYELRTLDTVIGMDLYSSTSTQCLFHQQAVNLSDSEKLGIDFPAFANPLSPVVLGPTSADGGSVMADGMGLGTGSSANIIPFGPVNLAFPSIRQTVDQTYTASDTGFYQANFLGIPPPNYGSYEVTAGPGVFLSPVGPAPRLVRNDLPFSEMYNIIPGYERQKGINKSLAAAKKSINASTNTTAAGAGNQTTIRNSTLIGRDIVDLPASDPVIRQQQSGQGTSLVIAGQEVAGLETSVPINYAGHNVSAELLSYPYFPFAANSSTISKTTLLARIWRNSHLGTMGRAYEGDTSYPIQILPTEFTKSAIAMYNWYDVNSNALNQTVPGTHLMPRFWDLGVSDPTNPAYRIVPGLMSEVLTGVNPNNMGMNGDGMPAPANDLTTNKTSSIKALNLLSGMKNTTGEENAVTTKENNTTAKGYNTTSVQPIKTPDSFKPYMPTGGPAGNGPGWDFAGPKQKAWLGGINNPWVTGPSNNIYFAGRGGPDWPPFYWGFGRYEGY
jgi:hypothetical protein